MKLKISQITKFSLFYDEIKNHKISFKTAYKLSTIQNEVASRIAFYQEQFQKIVQEYGLFDDNGNIIPTEDGQGVKLRPGTEAECYEKVGELDNLEIELNVPELNIDEFEGVEISPDKIEAILPFLK